MSIERVLADFEGIWTLSRKITQGAGASATFEGTAEWRAADGGLAYHETGVLYLPAAAPMTAERRYHWGADLSVYFDDGRYFHSVPARGGRAAHFCDPDTYVVDYDFAGWGGPETRAFTATWTVKGPRKAYVMANRFTCQR
ncbi:DUF6314 family protein [uncultured Tateyamaria sp.]|uniref:DUF6314 family protein n=1 Tax=uncultured Tateyamaria sp. TaxID=455651 RepID=UPI00262F9AE5|nr:DUF6314 family protein [uncultured Tateyamaria sp.]